MALEVDTKTGVEVIPLIIGGKEQPIASSRLFEVRSSATDKTVYLAQGATKEDAIKAADHAWEEFQTWKSVRGSTRREIFLRASKLVTERAQEFEKIMTAETSCRPEFVQFQVGFVAQMLQELAGRATTIQGHTPEAQTPGVFALTIKQPIGPALIISPWNSPLLLAARGLACPLIAGCTVVFKASELSPRTHHALVQLFYDAGLPRGAISKIQVDRPDAAEITETLIAHHAIKKVEFTGSNPVGSKIGQLCMKYLKPIFMELGGKSASIVLEDANLERAAELIVQGAYLHHGQICISTERVIVLESVAEKFTQLLKAQAEKVPHGGTAVQLRIAEHAEELISEAISKGAKALVGGSGFVGPSAAKPTILTGVTKDMRIYDEESFGPSFSLYVVKDEQEAVKLANDSKYGLSAAIHTRDMLRFIRLAAEIEVGQVAMNSMTMFEELTAPLGGAKGSGWGRCNGSYGIEEFLVEKFLRVAGADDF
ncbi:aldehyde dehydrogenase domain-containing protein [Xylogone sp. PMI_703]|nr:aldehyde dehydrogenase domain-containing protein [Xylogone sp. PMI_703]